MKIQFLIIALFTFLVSQGQSDSNGTFSTEKIIERKSYAYALHSPANKKEKKPLIVFLHGSGEKGTDTELVKVHGPFQYLKKHELDAYILAPQCPIGQVWDEEVVYKMILKIQKENNIDASRIYLTGLSLGGWGTFSLAFAHPEMFAAVMPVCGFVNRMQMDDVCKIAAIPTHIYHGLLDDVVSVDYSINTYKKLKACNGNVQLTIFDDANHDSWTRVYSNPEVYAWMFKQVKIQ